MTLKKRSARTGLESQPRGASLPQSFARVAQAFAHDARVTHGGRGFGASALKVDGKIFAMLSSAGQFVVKLPGTRVDEMVRSGMGQHFDARRGRKMKEWLALDGREQAWLALALEACRFVAGHPSDRALAPSR
ncbi:MAG TPA: hypothetical protein VIC29_08865 [Steroidobacteraceae bacterium]|jgi:hypothetical protein